MKTTSLALAAFVAGLALAPPAFACEGQIGEVVFEDDFTDDRGGWWHGSGLSEIRSPGGFYITLTPERFHLSSQNQMFSGLDGDYCLAFDLPARSATNVLIGLQFWIDDPGESFFIASAACNGTTDAFKSAGGQWTEIFVNRDAPGLRPGARNEIRVLAKAGRLTFFVNGIQQKVARAPFPNRPLPFAIFAQLYEATAPVEIAIARFRLTTGE